MSRIPLLIATSALVLLFHGTDLVAQSSRRGSRTRRPPIAQSRPSRLGGARPSVGRPRPAPTGMLNSARSGLRTGGSGPSSLRPSASALRRSNAGVTAPTPTAFGAASSSTPRRPRSAGTRSTASSPAAASAQPPQEDLRTWTDASGTYSIRGKMAAYRSETVWIRRADGLLAKLALSQLSPADQVYVRSKNP